MRTDYRTRSSAIRAALLIGLSASISIGAVAAPTGSTDIYAPDGIVASFGTPGEVAAQSHTVVNRYNGSTDTWAPGAFLASFGAPGSATRSPDTCQVGSTDIYGVNGFLASFAGSTASARIDLTQACAAPASVLR